MSFSDRNNGQGASCQYVKISVFTTTPSPGAAQDCRHPVVVGRCHREDPGGHRPSAGRQARPDGGAAYQGLPGRHTRFKQTEIGEIPEEWQLKRLAEVARVQTGLAKNKAKAGPLSVPYLRVANVQDGFLNFREMKSVEVNVDALSRYALKMGDVLFTEGGDADKLGRGAVWNGEIEPCLHQNHIFVARLFGDIRPMFLSLYGGSSRGKSYFLNCSKQTTNLASMNSTQLKRLPVPIPRLDEQEQILERLGVLDARLRLEEGCLNRLNDLKSALVSVLLTGELPRHPDAEVA